MSDISPEFFSIAATRIQSEQIKKLRRRQAKVKADAAVVVLADLRVMTRC